MYSCICTYILPDPDMNKSIHQVRASAIYYLADSWSRAIVLLKICCDLSPPKNRNIIMIHFPFYWKRIRIFNQIFKLFFGKFVQNLYMLNQISLAMAQSNNSFSSIDNKLSNLAQFPWGSALGICNFTKYWTRASRIACSITWLSIVGPNGGTSYR